MSNALYARMASACSSAGVSDLKLRSLAQRVGDRRVSARLNVLASFCRSHKQRLLVRMQAQRKLTLVPADGVVPESSAPKLSGDVVAELRSEAEVAKTHALYYEETANLARQHADLSIAWVCDLNRTEEQDRARELLSLVDMLSEVKVA